MAPGAGWKSGRLADEDGPDSCRVVAFTWLHGTAQQIQLGAADRIGLLELSPSSPTVGVEQFYRL